MLVIVNPYHRSVTIDGEEVVQKILEFPNKLNHLSTISCTYDSEEQKITKVHDLHRFTSNFIQREYFFEHLPEFVEWFYKEKQAQIEEDARLQKYKEDVENAVNQTVQAGINAQANIATDRTNAINAIESAHTTATNSITSKRAEALNAIQDAKAESLNTITETTNNSVSSVTGAMNTALNNISTERIAAINNISNDKADALAAIATDRRTSLEEINSSINKATAQADRSKTEADRSKYYADQMQAVVDVRPASKEQIGLVIVGDNIDVTEDGTISVSTPTLATTDEEGNPVEAKAGVVKIGKGLEVRDDGTVNVVTASADTIGGIKLGDGLNLDENGKVNVVGMSIATHETVGISKPSIDMTIDAEGTLTDKREFLYYDSPDDVPESGLPTNNVKVGAIAYINDGRNGSTLNSIVEEVIKRLPLLEFTNERIVGTLNGKKVYEKLIFCNAPMQINIPIDVYSCSGLNIDVVIDISGTIIQLVNMAAIPINIHRVSDTIPQLLVDTHYEHDTDSIRVWLGREEWVNNPMYVTMRYTKTTD